MPITGKTLLAGIMGWPVTYSRSPALHGFWLAETGVDGAYVPLPVRPEHLAAALRALPLLGFRGCNLTIPHKEKALALMDRVEPLARRIGAVNTVVAAADGSLEGRNTDAYGFAENLRDRAPGFEPRSGPAVVLGAGGAARAVVAALADMRVEAVRIVNRTVERAEALARDLCSPATTITIHPWSEGARVLADAGLLVNATSLGMTGSPPLALDIAGLPPAAPVADLVYVPLETALLAAARRRGHAIVDGLGMLLHQGRPGFEAWFGTPVAVSAAQRAAVLATLGAGR
ncbi:MAG TPA: shikimate dehydrogenase [Stellaceae bacterium]|nr:shikimate dehydrogenase [Stellaceae bacterium]